MTKILHASLMAVALMGASLTMAAPVDAAVVGVQLGGAGIGFSVTNGHYYDSRHRQHAYSYPSDWKTYHHPQSWYRSHSGWNDSNSRDYYRH